MKYAIGIFLFLTLQAEPISPIPLHVKYNVKKAELGKELFFDPQFSQDGTISCASCHDLFNGGGDARVVSVGVGKKVGNIQAPTLFNSLFNFKQFWNGRAKDLYEQANGPIHNPVEMSMSTSLIEKKLNASKKYKEEFYKVFHTYTVTYDLFIDAIVEFEKALITPNAKFDKYLRGEVKLTPEEQNGYSLFKQLGCITCHNGINIGANSFQKMGTFIEYKNRKIYPDRYAITHNTEDINVFKVPSLRNIAQTAPYFHDGSAKTLYYAVKKMSHYNLGIEISDKEAQSLTAFLKTLDGEIPTILKPQ